MISGGILGKRTLEICKRDGDGGGDIHREALPARADRTTERPFHMAYHVTTVPFSTSIDTSCVKKWNLAKDFPELKGFPEFVISGICPLGQPKKDGVPTVSSRNPRLSAISTPECRVKPTTVIKINGVAVPVPYN